MTLTSEWHTDRATLSLTVLGGFINQKRPGKLWDAPELSSRAGKPNSLNSVGLQGEEGGESWWIKLFLLPPYKVLNRQKVS